MDFKILDISKEELFELIYPLYGLFDAGYYSRLTIHDHLTNDIGMNPITGDGAVFVKKKDGEIIGIRGSYIDDCLNAGDEEFEQMKECKLQKFKLKPRVNDSFDFFGTQLRTIAPCTFTMSQQDYANHMTFVDTNCSFEEFRNHRALFSWMTHTCPDNACYTTRACQVSPNTFCKEKSLELNRGIKIVKDNADMGLNCKPHDTRSLELRVYADASFASNDDLSSQIGYTVSLCDASNLCHVIDFSSKKSRRTVRSIMAGEICAFMDALDTSFMLRSDMCELLGTDIPFLMITDSKQLFDATTRGKRTTEKHLMIDVAPVRQAYRRYEIYSIGLIRGDDNPADALSKIKCNDALHRTLRDRIEKTRVALWIKRSTVQLQIMNRRWSVKISLKFDKGISE